MAACEARAWRPLLARAGHAGLIERRRASKWRACCACGYAGRWNGSRLGAVDTLLTHLGTAARRIRADGYV